MPRKMKLEYITCDSKRNATFRKRKNGLMKKADEISTLCGIEACAIIYKENDHQPEVFPSDDKTKSILNKFLALSEGEKSRKMLDQESLLKKMILKAQKKLEKQKDDTRKKGMTNLMLQLMSRSEVIDNVSTNDLDYLSSLIDENLKEVEERIKLLEFQEVVENIGTQTMNIEGGTMGHVQGIMMGGGQENIGNVQGMVSGENLQRDVHAQGVETYMDDMQINQDWATNFTNTIDVVVPNVNVSNDFWPNPQLP